MEEKITKRHQAKDTNNENGFKKANQNYQATYEALKENEQKFHQSQYVPKIDEPSIPSANYNNGPSRMKINSMQDSFLNNCRHDRAVIEISLVDHTKEKGVIVGFDVNSIIMENEQKYQFLIMKSAIIKIIPTKFVNYIFNDNYKCMNMILDYSGIKNVGG